MRPWLGWSLAIIATIMVAFPVVSAHSPQFSGDNESLDGAKTVDEPTKSWVIYNTLHEGGEAQYYKMEFREGEEITVMLTVPPDYADKGFVPGMVMMGPGLVDNGTLPVYVEKVPGAGIHVFPGTLPPRADYEPFSPSAIVTVADVFVTAPQNGTYYIAVCDDFTGGNYGLAIGSRESFTVEEWLLIPFDSYRIYLWEGQQTWAVIAPSIVTFFLAVAMMGAISRRRGGIDIMWCILTFSGALMMASATMLIYQMIYAVSQSDLTDLLAVTVFIAGIGAMLGFVTFKIAYQDRRLTMVRVSTRTWLIVIFIVGLATWAGWVVGPALVALAAVLPGKVLKYRPWK